MAKVFSGMRPSGKLHLGNYLGALKNWIALQDESDTTQCIFAAVDLHGITTPYEPKGFHAQVYDVLLDYAAAGVNPEKSLLIRQSQIPQHTELMWLFSTITPVGWLERLPNWSEKVEQIDELGSRGASYQNNLGILAYPVLMAADILIYKSDLVPVGDEQLKHIDVTNEIASKFNHLFGETFPKVKAYIAPGSHILSLQDPSKKMSKTGDEGIALTDDADTVRDKIKRAVTDSGKEVKFDETEKPAISNLLTIYSTLAGMPVGEIEQDYDGKSYSEFKSDLAEVVVSFLKPIQERRAALASDMPLFEKTLKESEEQARTIAGLNLEEIRRNMGLR